MNTPEFLVWAVEHVCAVRGFQDGSDPERTERQLRAARAVSDAEREGRVLEGVAVRGEEGFRVEEAMGVYGGRAAVEGACGGCVANVLAVREQKMLAGCYGMVVCPWRSESFQGAVDGAIEETCKPSPGLPSANHPLPKGEGSIGRRDACPTGRLGWYGLWMGSPLVGERLAFAASVLETVQERERERNGAEGLSELAFALRVASERGLSVHVAVYPEGSVEAGWFVLSPHCPKCKMTWPTREKQMCAACGYEGFPAPLRKRRARGRRPYFPLARLLGVEGAREVGKG